MTTPSIATAMRAEGRLPRERSFGEDPARSTAGVELAEVMDRRDEEPFGLHRLEFLEEARTSTVVDRVI
jgi:hypothetical protein